MSKQRYIIIRGQVFRWEEKAPFRQSGKSIDGALEYDREAELLKCHECGEWHRGLAHHVAQAHKRKDGEQYGAMAYKREHHLRSGTGLLTPGLRAAKRAARPASRLPCTPRGWLVKRPRNTRTAHEEMNARNECHAQTILEIQTLAAALGRVPTCGDASKKLEYAATARFGSWNKALKAAGIDPINLREFRSKDALREALIDFYVLNRRVPRTAEWGDGRLASLAVYKRHFGSIRAAYADAGLALVAQQQRPVLMGANAAD